MMIEQYQRNNKNVSVVSEYKDKHKDICICHQGCIHFAPNRKDNCYMAKTAFEMSNDYGLVLVMECDSYANQNIRPIEDILNDRIAILEEEIDTSHAVYRRLLADYLALKVRME